MSDIDLIDTHVHFWNYDSIRYAWIDASMAKIKKDFHPKDYKESIAQTKVAGCVAVQADQSEEETDYLLHLASQFEFIKGVVGWIDLTSENVSERLDHYSKNPFFKGVRHTVWDKKGEFLLEPAFLNGIAELSKRHLTFDILVFEYQIPSAIKLVEQFPEQKFILNHLGKPIISHEPSIRWTKGIYHLAENPNVYCKLSGLLSDPAASQLKLDQLSPYMKTAISAFGEKRVVFGSDWPVSEAFSSFGQQLKMLYHCFAGSTETEISRILSENSANFYNLDLI